MALAIIPFDNKTKQVSSEWMVLLDLLTPRALKSEHKPANGLASFCAAMDQAKQLIVSE